MTEMAIASAKADIEATTDLLERALKDEAFDWAEAERLAASPDFAILDEFRRLRQEMSNGLAK